MKTSIADLHCHSTFFPRNQMLHNLWHQRHWFYPSQGDFTKLARGGTRVLFLTLYPIEQGYMTCGIFGLGTGDISDRLAGIGLRFPKERADEIQDYDHSYFKDLLGEYDLLKDSPESKMVRLKIFDRKKEFHFKVVRNFDELKNVLRLDGDYNPAKDNIIAVIPTIEGAHSLGTGQFNTHTLNYTNLSVSIKKNIIELKKLGPANEPGLYCPFFISLSHFFWNQLGGHAVSLWTLFGKVFNQNTGINRGIESLGEFVVNELLSEENGKRILIDVAHMSVNVRRWYYYEYLPQRKELHPEETIPIIVSHTGVNGWKDISESEILGSSDIVHNFADNRYENSTKFNPWDVFISDEEILIIHDSGGLIGLSLDERIMMGRKTLHALKKRTRFLWGDSARKIWIQPFIEQILHIAETIKERAKNDDETSENNKIWDNICIGSDYDGMITPVKGFRSASHFPDLDKMVFDGLKINRNSAGILSGKSDSEIREITDKIVWKNALQFLERHFV